MPNMRNATSSKEPLYVSVQQPRHTRRFTTNCTRDICRERKRATRNLYTPLRDPMGQRRLARWRIQYVFTNDTCPAETPQHLRAGENSLHPCWYRETATRIRIGKLSSNRECRRQTCRARV